MSKMTELAEKALALVKKTDWAALLVLRVSIGTTFATTAWGKIHNIDKVIALFRDEWHVPMPEFNAVFTSYTELICGTLLVLGLGTRLAAIPVTVIMIVAIITAKAHDVHGFVDLVDLDEWTYLTVFLVLFAFGAGAASLDGLIKRLRPPSRAAAAAPAGAKNATA
jgi:putative oxidoreductase